MKWAPFSSLVEQKSMIEALVLEKQKLKKTYSFFGATTRN